MHSVGKRVNVKPVILPLHVLYVNSQVTLARIYSASRLDDVIRRYRADPFTHETDFTQYANDAVANVQRRVSAL